MHSRTMASSSCHAEVHARIGSAYRSASVLAQHRKIMAERMAAFVDLNQTAGRSESWALSDDQQKHPACPVRLAQDVLRQNRLRLDLHFELRKDQGRHFH